MSIKLDSFNKVQLKQGMNIRPGDTVRVHQKIKEGDKERIQVFEGLVIAKKHGRGINATITVRKVVEGIGVERIFPLHSPSVEKMEIVKSGKVRRAKLYFLRTAKGKRAKLKNREFSSAIADEEQEKAAQEETVTETADKQAEPAEDTPESTETQEQK